MLKSNVGSLVLVLGVVFCACSCSSSETQIERDAAVTGGTTTTGGASATGGKTGSASATGGTTPTGVPPTGGTSAAAGGASATGGSSATGGVSAAGGSATTGGAISTGGASAAGGGTGTSTMTLAQACAHNCTFAVGALDLTGSPSCSTTQDVCVQSCMTTFDNTSAVNADLGRQYTEMMVCVATDPAFSSSADFVCAKPNSPLNLWSPAGTDVVPNSTCEDKICFWNCDDATHGNMDPWVDLRCFCSSVH